MKVTLILMTSYYNLQLMKDQLELLMMKVMSRVMVVVVVTTGLRDVKTTGLSPENFSFGPPVFRSLAKSGSKKFADLCWG